MGHSTVSFQLFKKWSECNPSKCAMRHEHHVSLYLTHYFNYYQPPLVVSWEDTLSVSVIIVSCPFLCIKISSDYKGKFVWILLFSASTDGRIFVWKINEGPDDEDKPQITGKVIVALQITGDGESFLPRVCWHSHKQVRKLWHYFS